MEELLEKVEEHWKSLTTEEEKDSFIENLSDITIQMCQHEDEDNPTKITTACDILQGVVDYYNNLGSDEDRFGFSLKLHQLFARIRELFELEDSPLPSEFEKKILEHIQESSGDFDFSEDDCSELSKAYEQGGDCKYCDDDWDDDWDDEENDEDYYDEEDGIDSSDISELPGESFSLYVFCDRVYVIVDGAVDCPLHTFSGVFQSKAAELVEKHFNCK